MRLPAEPLLLQVEQPQLSQSLLTGEVFQALCHVGGSLQNADISVELRRLRTRPPIPVVASPALSRREGSPSFTCWLYFNAQLALAARHVAASCSAWYLPDLPGSFQQILYCRGSSLLKENFEYYHKLI